MTHPPIYAFRQSMSPKEGEYGEDACFSMLWHVRVMPYLSNSEFAGGYIQTLGEMYTREMQVKKGVLSGLLQLCGKNMHSCLPCASH